MERIGFLINKLKEQHEKADSKGNMLVTLQMLYRELQPKIDGAALIRSVAIVVPGQMDLSFLEKGNDEYFAAPTMPSTTAKQVFEPLKSPVVPSQIINTPAEQRINAVAETEIPSVTVEKSFVDTQSELIVHATPSVTVETPNAIVNSSFVVGAPEKPNEPLNVAAPNIKVEAIKENGQWATAKNEVKAVNDTNTDISFEAINSKLATDTTAMAQPKLEVEKSDINDRFSLVESINSRFTTPEKAELPTATANAKPVQDTPLPNPYFGDTRFMPQQPLSKPEPTPAIELPVVEVPVFAKPSTVASTVGPVKEIHESISVSAYPSFNDKQEKRLPELFNTLKAEPLKDLKKAISINDRFQYINNLFMGDETVYERSVKTINHFNVYSEAEFWIRRELITKMGWDKDNAIVQQFMALVQRRFA